MPVCKRCGHTEDDHYDRTAVRQGLHCSAIPNHCMWKTCSCEEYEEAD